MLLRLQIQWKTVSFIVSMATFSLLHHLTPHPHPHRVMSTAAAKRRMSMIARPKSTVVNTAADLGTQGTYTVNQYGPEVQNPTFVNQWTNGNENGFEDSEIGVESLKSRIGGCVCKSVLLPIYCKVVTDVHIDGPQYINHMFMYMQHVHTHTHTCARARTHTHCICYLATYLQGLHNIIMIFFLQMKSCLPRLIRNCPIQTRRLTQRSPLVLGRSQLIRRGRNWKPPL